MPIDFTKRYRDYARFIPAVSEMFARYIVAQNPKRPLPTGLTQADLDFLIPGSKLYHIRDALYSAGQAAKGSGKTHRPDQITGRDPKNGNTIVGDSGGFQIQQGSIKFKGDQTRERMLRWLETYCDWAMILDFPTGGIDMGTVAVHTQRLLDDGDVLDVTTENGVKQMNLEEFCEYHGFSLSDPQQAGYATCLFQTLINNDYFIKHRVPGATRFLNVVQGRTIEESDFWYDKVKHYQFEGWSLAGPHKEKFDMTLTRLLAMRRDGLLENKNWMHILGVGKLANGCAYTTMQRMIRKHDNPNFTISYDVSSPFTTAAYGNLFLGYTLDKNGWTIQSDKLDGKEYLNTYDPNDPLMAQKAMDENGLEYIKPNRSKIKFFDVLQELWAKKMKSDNTSLCEGIFDQEERSSMINNSRLVETEISKYLTMGDICVNDDPKYTSTWDVVSYAMMMHHNVQVHLEAVFEAQELYDKGDVHRVPQSMIILRELIEEILDPECKNPEELIRKHRKDLNCLAGEKSTQGIIVADQFEFTDPNQHNNELDQLKKAQATAPVKVEPVDNLFAF